MTKSEFINECVSRTISPDIALENNDIVEALRNKDDSKVIDLLNTQF